MPAMTIPYTKPPLTIEQQLDLLAEHGLNISDCPSAISTLARISYYRLSAYCLVFKDDHDYFRPGTTWDEVVTLYEFDRKLRIVVMDALERVEVAIRTAITYTLAHTYGAFGHHYPTNFRPTFQHEQWLAKLTTEIVKSHETFIQHYKVKYDGFPRLPIWMESEIMSFGSLSRLYEGMEDIEQQQISKFYGLPHYVLRSWLRSLNFIRNVCAHHSRFWNRELSVAPVMPKKKHGWPSEEIPNHKRLFAILVMLGHLLDRQGIGSNWRLTVTNLIEPVANTERFRIAMGLPEEWKSHRRWNISSGGGT
jgi:abortive infection bacteriophage resistance protein